MATISKIAGSQPQLTGQVGETTRPQPEKTRPSRETDIKPSQNKVLEEFKDDSLDQHKIQDLMDRLQRTMNEHSAEPHEVGFRQDPVSKNVIIEIRNPEGELLKQFPPEKVLNLHQKLDELSGIVIDRMT
ncbi:MAG: flagellar protein FlaG [Gemmatimonadales bacterium]|nr:flagellar protein FlaG [Gemmatimonadales bacterium]